GRRVLRERGAPGRDAGVAGARAGRGGAARRRGGGDVDGADPHHEGARARSAFAARRLCRGGVPRPVLAGRGAAEPGLHPRRAGDDALRLGQRGADAVAVPLRGHPPGRARPRAARPHRRQHDGTEPRRARRGQPAGGAAVRAVRRARGAGRRPCVAAVERGRTAYTVFATTRERLQADPEPYRRMTRAIARTLAWVAAAAPGELAAAIAPYFPALDRAVLAGALARYKAQGVWAQTPALSQDGFLRLQRALLASGYLARPVPFAACTDGAVA